jgi:cytochrome c553
LELSPKIQTMQSNKEFIMKTLVIAALAAVVSTGAMAAGNADAGKGKVAMCAGCHGANGKAMVPTYPNLAGQNAAYLEGALKAYKTQERKGYQAPIMYGMSAALSDQDIADIAAYYASQK